VVPQKLDAGPQINGPNTFTDIYIYIYIYIYIIEEHHCNCSTSFRRNFTGMELDDICLNSHIVLSQDNWHVNMLPSTSNDAQ
jgi:hypothetical protein